MFTHHIISITMQGNITTALLFGLLLLVTHISDRASILPSNAPEHRVAATAAYTVASASFTHGVCEIILHHLGYDELQTEPQQSSPRPRPLCRPYAVTVAAVVGKAHVYFTGGYGDTEWKVIYKFAGIRKAID